jgi:hypothetical protein
MNRICLRGGLGGLRSCGFAFVFIVPELGVIEGNWAGFDRPQADDPQACDGDC